jgi:hypothetical protein
MHSNCPPTPQQQQSQQELKYNPSADDLLRKQLLGEDFLQQLPQVIQQQSAMHDAEMSQQGQSNAGHLE